MISLIELLDEIRRIVNIKRRRILLGSATLSDLSKTSINATNTNNTDNTDNVNNTDDNDITIERNKKLPEEKETLTKKIQFDILKNLESCIARNYGPLINDYLFPYASSVKRFGVLRQCGSSPTNISFYTSLITILFTEYSDESLKKMYDITQNGVIISLIDDLITFLVSIIDKMDFSKDSFITKTFDWKKKELINSINNRECDKTVIGMISYIFDLNIFLFHVSKDNIFAIYPEQKFNKYKNTIALSFHYNTFEPLMLNDSFIWKFEKPENDISDNDLLNSKNLFLKLMTINYTTMIALDIGLKTNSKKFKHAQYDELYTMN